MNDRIKLAEAMKVEYWRSEVFGGALGLPDPFTDANDDYAVLEWMRSEARREGVSWMNGSGILSLHATNYQIGDYARAALKVIE